MADFSSVPILDVHTGNIDQLWPMLTSVVKSSMFIAIDIEMSGLGDRKKLFVRDMDERYKNMCDAARTRSIIAMGLSCFQYVPLKGLSDTRSSHENCNFLVQTFNLMLLSTEPYTVDPGSLKFLIDHGFDFNTQYAQGLPYTPPTSSQDASTAPSIQRLLEELVLHKVPVVLHNGLMDLVFIYQNLHCPLPASMSTFVTDLSQLFSGGLYDTKFLAEFQARVSASYLEYVFRKCQRCNMDRSKSGQRCVTLSFLSYPVSTDLTFLPCGLQYNVSEEVVVCENYANHGWCVAGTACMQSHDVDLIIDKENTVIQKRQNKKRRKRNRKAAEELLVQEENQLTTTETEECTDNKMDCGESLPELESLPGNDNTQTVVEQMNQICDGEEQGGSSYQSEEASNAPLIKEGRTGGHRAGFDAFMTGFAFAHYMATFSEVGLSENAKLEDFQLAKFANKLSMSGKDVPLQVMKSSFSKPSKAHNQRMQKILASAL